MNRQKRPSGKKSLSPTRKRWLARSRDESGSVAVITAICLVFLVGFVALVLDVGHLYAVRSELQNAADAAALAGARALFPISGYPDATLIPLTDPPYCSLAVSAGRAAAASNQAGGVANLATAPADVQTGIWNWDAKNFTPDATPSYNINSVEATVRRDSVANQPVGSWFAHILGVESTPVNALSVAAVGYIKQPTGKILPIWIPTDIWDMLPDDNTIKASPDPGDMFAWCAPVPESANASYVKDAIKGDATNLPAISEVVNLNNGVLGSAHQAIQRNINAAPATDYCYPDGTPIVGWLTGIMTGNRLNADGSEYHPPDGTPLDIKMNKQGNVGNIEPVIVTNVVNSKGGWSIEFVKLNIGAKFVWPGASPGGPASQIFATQPVIVK
ncbi:MAG: Tad domain-containing protein [Proteobacteria bacterium]|nr:Tad domain-containing protein [Pseudomonadota bacterium]